jgi:hypothetical protein
MAEWCGLPVCLKSQALQESDFPGGHVLWGCVDDAAAAPARPGARRPAGRHRVRNINHR